MGVAQGLETKQEHILIGKAIHAFESSALNFSARAIPDATARLQYMQAAYEYSKELLDAFKKGKLTAKQAAEQAYEMRNIIMDTTRGKTCEIAQAYAFKKKAAGLSLPHLQEKYSKRLYGKKFDQLSKGAKSVVWKEIVLASGRPHVITNKLARVLGKAGKGFLFATVTIAVYNVVTAEDTIKAASKETAVLSSGLLGSVAGGAAAGCVCGPGAPVCVAVGVFLGGVMFAIGAEFTFDSYWK